MRRFAGNAITRAEYRGDAACESARLARDGLDDHAGQPRMQWKPGHLAARGRQAARFIERMKPSQKLFGGGDGRMAGSSKNPPCFHGG